MDSTFFEKQKGLRKRNNWVTFIILIYGEKWASVKKGRKQERMELVKANVVWKSTRLRLSETENSDEFSQKSCVSTTLCISRTQNFIINKIVYFTSSFNSTKWIVRDLNWISNEEVEKFYLDFSVCFPLFSLYQFLIYSGASLYWIYVFAAASSRRIPSSVS